ncbi:MAG: cytochrome P450 [Caldilineaceae bacterium]
MTTLTLNSTHSKQVPILRGWPFLGNLWPLSRDVIKFLESCVHRYDEIVAIRVIGNNFYLVTHPDLIEEVLLTKNAKFQKSKSLKEFSRPVFGNGLLASDGDFWLRQRRLAQPAFHRQRIAAYGTTMVNYTNRLIADWKEGEVRDLHSEMMRLTLEVVAKTLFNKEATGEVTEIGEILDAIMARFATSGLINVAEAILGRELPIASNKRYHQAVSRLDEIVRTVIEERRANHEDKGDLIGMFLAARDEDGSGMSDQQLLDECKTMFLAGHETTALTLSWTWWLLDANPQAKQKLQQELRQVLNGRSPTLADLPNLPYTGYIIAESMRLMPPAWTIEREALEDVEIGGYLIPKGAQVGMTQYGVHRDPRWYANPNQFLPERWANDLLKRLPKYAYFPFGGGPRICIGQQFALMEAQLMLATLAQKFDFELIPGQRIEPQPSITMRPKYGLKMRIKQLG